MENWKIIPGYEDYMVSDLGRVKSLKNYRRFKPNRILKPCFSSSGYLCVVLHKDNKRKTFNIHKLVMMSFFEYISEYKLVIDHINNDKSDNRLENLQIITNRENCSKDKKNKSSKYTGVSWIDNRKKWRCQININGKVKHLGYFNNEEDASNVYKNKLKNYEL